MSRAYDLDRAHVFHSWSAQATLDPMVIERAEGARVYDEQGRSFLDFSSQLVFTNIGHQHPKVVAAIQEQAAKLCTVAPQHANDARSEAARLIAEIAPAGLEHVFFTNGGAEAIEHAVRMARLHTGRIKVLSRYRSYHGGTNTAVNLTGDPRRFAERLRLGRHREVLRAVPLPLGVRRHHRGRGVRAGAAPPAPHRRARGPEHGRRDRAGVHPGHRRDHDPAAGLPARRARDLRRPRHRAGARRGDGRLRSRRVVAGARPARRGARPGHLRQGRHLRLRPARRRHRLRGDLRDLRAPRLPRRADLLRPPAGLRRRGRHHRRHARRGHRRERRPPGARGHRARAAPR